MREYLTANGLPGNSPLLNGIMQEILQGYTDNQIRGMAVNLLQCADIKEAERQEILHFLYIV